MKEKYLKWFGNEWYEEMKDFLHTNTFSKIGKQIGIDRKDKVVIPSKDSDLFLKAFRTTPISKVNVILLGMDPYHTIDSNNKQPVFDGLAFSCSNSFKAQPSLVNILKEVEDDIYDGFNVDRVSNFSLYSWAEQGVLLINTAHSVIKSKPGSHLKLWEPFTKEVFKVLNRRDNIIWLMMGNNAKKYKSLIINKSHSIIEVGHPSPLNTSIPFKGTKPFSKINNRLKLLNKKEIIW